MQHLPRWSTHSNGEMEGGKWWGDKGGWKMGRDRLREREDTLRKSLPQSYSTGTRAVRCHLIYHHNVTIGRFKASEKMGLCKFKVKISKGHYEASRWLEKAVAFFLLLFLPSIILHWMWGRQPFLFASHSPHPLPLERCKVNISIGLQWPVSASLIPTLLFEGSIVPDLLAWFACLWIMAKKLQSGPLPSTYFSLSRGWASKHT